MGTVYHAAMEGILTLDVEDWDHANYRQLAGREADVSRAHRHALYPMEKNVERWIELLAAKQAKSTCFVLGQFAQRYPGAVRQLARAGHEIASHSYTHDLVSEMTREQFRESLKRSIGVIGELTGEAPIGFRAPSWSVSRTQNPWFIEELLSQGIRYDSSLFPVRTPLYGEGRGAAGNPAMDLKPRHEDGLFRIPVPVYSWAGVRWPFSSGAFFRLSPLALIRRGLAAAQRGGQAPMVVLHPRELDPAHPRLPLRGWERWVHYARLDSTEPKLRDLLERFRWSAICERYGAEIASTG